MRCHSDETSSSAWLKCDISAGAVLLFHTCYTRLLQVMSFIGLGLCCCTCMQFNADILTSRALTALRHKMQAALAYALHKSNQPTGANGKHAILHPQEQDRRLSRPHAHTKAKQREYA